MTEPMTLEKLIARESPEVQAEIQVEFEKLRQQVEDPSNRDHVAGHDHPEVNAQRTKDQSTLGPGS